MTLQKSTSQIGGKYRDIIIAASLFVIFDLLVLILNFYTSFEIAEDATAINLAGRQRMLSQGMTKTILQLANSEELHAQALAELDTTSKLFDTTLYAFTQGGSTRNTDGTDITMLANQDRESADLLKAAWVIWTPMRTHIHQLLDDPDNLESLSATVTLANAKNLELLKLMNQLTTRLAVLAQQKAERLRLFQSIGMVLVLINFGLLLLHFLKKLKRSDAATEEAKKETDEILSTVNEGFFLVDEDLNLGHQNSAAMSRILKREIIPSSPFLSLLKDKVSQQTLDTAHEYIKLLFTKRIRENLASDLNPLLRLEIDLSDYADTQDIRYLNITFKRVQAEGKISHLLGTLADITDQVRLEVLLKTAEAKSKDEMELLSRILQSNPLQIKEFLLDTKKLLLSINTLFEKSKTDSDYLEIINQSLPAIHKLKGDASVIGNDVFVGMVHEFELILKTTQSGGRLTPRNLLPVTIHINTMLSKINMVSTIIDRISKLVPIMSESPSIPRNIQWQEDFNRLKNKICKDLNKVADIHMNTVNLDLIEDSCARRIHDICIQMLRNALVHGIEHAAERELSGKDNTGNINISIIAQHETTDVVIRDDGRGLAIDKIRQSLLKNKHYTREQLAEMDDKAIILSIFSTGVTTAAELTEHAGNGVGLNIVKQAIFDLGGRLMIGSRISRYTEFRIIFSNVALHSNTGVIAA